MTPAKTSPTRVAGRCFPAGGPRVTPGFYPALFSTTRALCPQRPAGRRCGWIERGCHPAGWDGTRSRTAADSGGTAGQLIKLRHITGPVGGAIPSAIRWVLYSASVCPVCRWQ